jgi:hypothetical protein
MLPSPARAGSGTVLSHRAATMPLPLHRFAGSRMVAWASVVLVVLAAALGLGDLLVSAPSATDRLRDDAFYEFAWAANLATGRGPVVSDGVTTSGVQLLWSLCLVPLVWLGGAPALPLLAPWLGFLLHLATAVAWWLGTRSRAAGALLGLLWLGNPLLVRECQNGQETALAALLASLLWLGRRTREPRFVLLAVLAVAARSDLLPLVAAMSWWRHRQQPVRALLAPAVALAVQLGANLWLGGGLLPDSALPMAWLWHGNEALADPGGARWWATQWWYLRPVLLGGPFATASAMGLGLAVFLLLRARWPSGLRVLPALSVGIASALGAKDMATAGWTALCLALCPASGRRAVPRGLLAVLCGLGAIVALHWAVRWYPRDYYLAPLVVAAMVVWQRLGRLRLVLAVAAAAQLLDRGRVRPEPLHGQAEMVLAGEHLRHVVPPGERVGCFNSGLVTFHAAVLAAPPARRGIVNLDGVVDARAFAALREGTLSAWLDQQGVRFLVDNPVQFALDPALPHASGPWFGAGFDPARDLVEVARFDVPGVGNGRPGGDSFRLYWRRGRGEPPVPPTEPRVLAQAAGTAVVAWPLRAGQQLELVHGDGRREPLLQVDVDTTAVLPVAWAGDAAVTVAVAGGPGPGLRLSPL